MAVKPTVRSVAQVCGSLPSASEPPTLLGSHVGALPVKADGDVPGACVFTNHSYPNAGVNLAPEAVAHIESARTAQGGTQ